MYKNNSLTAQPIFLSSSPLYIPISGTVNHLTQGNRCICGDKIHKQNNRCIRQLHLVYGTHIDVDMCLDHSHPHVSAHIKPSNLKQYLHSSSCSSIPLPLAIQEQCIYSYPDDNFTYNVNLTQSFLIRSYPFFHVNKSISFVSRFPQTNNVCNFSSIIITYYPSLLNLKTYRQKSFPIFLPDPLQTIS